MTSEREVSRAAVSYRNVVLTVICGLLVFLSVRGLGVGNAGGEAVASNSNVPRVPNAAAQRLQMIQELKELGAITKKLGTIEQTLDQRLTEVEQRLVEQTAMMKTEQRRRGRSEEQE